jgi:hypothetical protein
MPGRLSSRFQNAMLLSLSVLSALLLAEAAARLFSSAPPGVVEVASDEGSELRRSAENQQRLDVRGYGDSSRPLFVTTPTGRRLRANAHVRIKHFLNQREIDFRTNSLGYRNREIGPKSIFRVLFLGDSITGADYLEEEESFVRQVERLSWSTEFPLETINAGVGAISLMNELAILEETGISTEPDAVVLGFYLNDFNESYGFSVGRLPGWLNRSTLVWLVARGLKILEVEFVSRGAWTHASLLPLQEEIHDRFQPAPGDPLTDRRAFFQEVSDSIMDWGSGWSAQLWYAMSPLFQRFRQLADEHGFEPLILVFPVALQARAEFLEDYPQRRIKQIARNLDIPVLDLLPIVRGASDKDALFYDLCHYTPLGNRLIAEEILRFIQQNADVPRGEVPARLREVARR